MAKTKTMRLRTRQQAREWLKENGITVADFARGIKASEQSVRDLLRGKSQGEYGDAHRAAIALGMKPKPATPIKLQDGVAA